MVSFPKTPSRPHGSNDANNKQQVHRSNQREHYRVRSSLRQPLDSPASCSSPSPRYKHQRTPKSSSSSSSTNDASIRARAILAAMKEKRERLRAARAVLLAASFTSFGTDEDEDEDELLDQEEEALLLNTVPEDDHGRRHSPPPSSTALAATSKKLREALQEKQERVAKMKDVTKDNTNNEEASSIGTAATEAESTMSTSTSNGYLNTMVVIDGHNATSKSQLQSQQQGILMIAHNNQSSTTSIKTMMLLWRRIQLNASMTTLYAELTTASTWQHALFGGSVLWHARMQVSMKSILTERGSVVATKYQSGTALTSMPPRRQRPRNGNAASRSVAVLMSEMTAFVKNQTQHHQYQSTTATGEGTSVICKAASDLLVIATMQDALDVVLLPILMTMSLVCMEMAWMRLHRAWHSYWHNTFTSNAGSWPKSILWTSWSSLKSSTTSLAKSIMAPSLTSSCREWTTASWSCWSSS